MSRGIIPMESVSYGVIRPYREGEKYFLYTLVVMVVRRN